jgi:hypothetical protein
MHQSNKISQITDTFKTKVLKPSEDNYVHHVIFSHYICSSGGSSVHPVLERVSGCCLTPTLQLFTKPSPISQQSFSQIVRVNVPMTVCMIVDQIKN